MIQLSFILLIANSLIDFILPTCPGIPDSMWIVSGKMIKEVCNNALTLVPAGVLLNLLAGGLRESTTAGRIDVSRIIRLVGKTIFICFFIIYIKRIAFTWEVFVDKMCPRHDVVMQVLQVSPEEVASQFKGGIRGIPAFFGLLFKGIYKLVKNSLTIVTIEGMIALMNYLKSILLIFLCIVGPYAAALSLFPFDFKPFSSWIRSYVTVSLQCLTLDIFSVLASCASLVSMGQRAEATTSFLLSIALFISVLFSSAFTYMWLGTVMTPNLAGGIGQIASRSLGGIAQIASRSSGGIEQIASRSSGKSFKR